MSSRAAGRSVALIDKAGRIKPCGGAIPPRLIRDFAIPDHLLVAKITSARMISPRDRKVDMPIEGGFVGMVDREHLRRMAARARPPARRDAELRDLRAHRRDEPGVATVNIRVAGRDGGERMARVRARLVIGADGAAPRGAPGDARARKTRVASSPITRSSRAGRRPGRITTARAATSITAARSRPTSTPGCFRMARP